MNLCCRPVGRRRARLAACCRAVSEDWLDRTVKRVGLLGIENALLLALCADTDTDTPEYMFASGPTPAVAYQLSRKLRTYSVLY